MAAFTAASVAAKGRMEAPALSSAQASQSSAQRPPDEVLKEPHRHNPEYPVNVCGSIIQVDNLSVGESVPLAGLDNSLVYFTNRVQGRLDDYSIRIPYRTSLSSGSQTSRIEVRIAGRIIVEPSKPMQTGYWTFVWDGKDANGQLVPGAALARVFYPDNPLNGDSNTTQDVVLGGWKAINAGLGGWMFNDHHYYDSLRQRLYMGSGEIRQLEAMVVHMDIDGQVVPHTTTLPPNSWLVTSETGDKAYLFDLEGRHIETRSTRSGALLKRFVYDNQKRLS